MSKKAEMALNRLVDSLNEEQKLDLIRVLAWAWHNGAIGRPRRYASPGIT